MKKRIALFPGSFDPFTIGHESIVLRALSLFDEVIVAVGDNSSKIRYVPLHEEIERIERYFADQPCVHVMAYQGLTVDVVRETNASVIVRGVRDIKDYEYERSLADINRSISGVETIFLNTLQMHSHVSSAVVRELKKYGKEVTDFLPSDKSINY